MGGSVVCRSDPSWSCTLLPAVLIAGGVIIWMTWGENYGCTAEGEGLRTSMAKAYQLIKGGAWGRELAGQALWLRMRNSNSS